VVHLRHIVNFSSAVIAQQTVCMSCSIRNWSCTIHLQWQTVSFVFESVMLCIILIWIYVLIFASSVASRIVLTQS